MKRKGTQAAPSMPEGSALCCLLQRIHTALHLALARQKDADVPRHLCAVDVYSSMCRGRHEVCDWRLRRTAHETLPVVRSIVHHCKRLQCSCSTFDAEYCCRSINLHGVLRKQ